MKYIDLVICMNDDLGIQSCVIDQNDTGLPSDSNLIKKVCITLLRSLSLNKEYVEIQDLLNELNITKET